MSSSRHAVVFVRKRAVQCKSMNTDGNVVADYFVIFIFMKVFCEQSTTFFFSSCISLKTLAVNIS